MNYPISKIVSGGQTGADQGGLNASIQLGIPYGGWCRKGRKSENGVIPAIYDLKETASADYRIRTERNVVESDATIVFTYGQPTGGSEMTIALAEKHGKHWIHINLGCSVGWIFTRKSPRAPLVRAVKLTSPLAKSPNMAMTKEQGGAFTHRRWVRTDMRRVDNT
ncbi:MAG: putative molybdenum carrier protein [candidate division Zixibacteria bacterium]|jgi:hypothetical protein|nr:putative molybdenum carrier protein [candidate division Zixibacteria bacterium]